jgi:hypothetical protein
MNSPKEADKETKTFSLDEVRQMVNEAVKDATTQMIMSGLAAARPSSAPVEQRAPHIEKFSGDRTQLESFIGLCKNALAGMPRTYPDGTSKVRFVITNLALGSPVHAAVMLLEARMIRAPELQDLELFFAWMRRRFGDPDRKRNALAELNSLRMMGTGDAANYFTKFGLLVDELGWTEESQLIARAMDGLTTEIIDCFANSMGFDPTTVAELEDWVMRLDKRHVIRKAQRLAEKQAKTTTISPRQGSGGGTYAGAVNGGVAITTGVSSPTTTTVPIRRTFTRLTDEERQGYMRDGKCFICGELGHRVRECPKKAARIAENPTNSATPGITITDASGNVRAEA